MWRAVGFLTIAVLLSGCGRGQSKYQSLDKVDVLATVYPLAELAQEVGGPVVDVSWVVESGQSLRGVRPDTGLRDRLTKARLIVYNSGVSEPWIDADSSMALGGQRLLRLDMLPPSANSDTNGFLWLDPLIARAAAQELRSRLLALRSKQQSILNDRTDYFVSQIDALLHEYQPRFEPVHGKAVLTLSHDFDPLLRRVGLTPVLITETSATEMSDESVRELKQVAGRHNTHLLALSSDVPSQTVRFLTESGGVQVVAIDPLGSSAENGRHTYIELMRYDFEALLRALVVE